MPTNTHKPHWKTTVAAACKHGRSLLCVYCVCSVCNLEPSQPGIRPFEPAAVGWKLKLTSNEVKKINQYWEVRIYPCHRFVLIYSQCQSGRTCLQNIGAYYVVVFLIQNMPFLHNYAFGGRFDIYSKLTYNRKIW